MFSFYSCFVFKTIISVFILTIDYLEIGKPSNKSNCLSVTLSWSYEYSILFCFLCNFQTQRKLSLTEFWMHSNMAIKESNKEMRPNAVYMLIVHAFVSCKRF